MSLPPLPSPSCCFLAILWLCHLLYSLVPVILLERSAAGSGLVSWDSCSDSHCSLPAATIGISERNFLKSSAAWHWMFQVTTHSGLSPRALFKVKFRQGNLNKACFFFFFNVSVLISWTKLWELFSTCVLSPVPALSSKRWMKRHHLLYPEVS